MMLGVMVGVSVGRGVIMGTSVFVGEGVTPSLHSVGVGMGVLVGGATVKVGVAERKAMVSIADQVRAAAVDGQPGISATGLTAVVRVQARTVKKLSAKNTRRRQGLAVPFVNIAPP